MAEEYYHIGTKGIKWGKAEKEAWYQEQTIKRSYQELVVDEIKNLAGDFNVVQYGALSYDVEKYPLFVIQSKDFSAEKINVLVTGGVHGYETSGVHGAIRFVQSQAKYFLDKVNLVVAPCISPWGYETINRWNPLAIDPNRSFYADSPSEEAAAIINYLNKLDIAFDVHIDLHETTDTDNSEFRPALAARDAVEHKNWSIPDGFYLVADSVKPEAEFQTAIIKSVEKVTHIAPADEENRLIGEPIEQVGVINYAAKSLGLCMGMTEAKYVTTTEVYPDSPVVDDENCILAQVAAVTGAIDYVIAKENNV
ncbi:M14 family metallopeptidase [Thalassotalea ganghwensis]